MDEKAGWTPPWFAEAVKSGRAKRYIGPQFAVKGMSIDLP